MWGGLVGGGVPLGRAGRAPGTHVLLILRIERVHHILRGFGIVAALLETLHRVRLGLLHRHLSARTCTAGWTVDAGAARVSPALSGAVGRGNARVSGLGRGAGLVHQLQTVGDCVGSGCGGCAGVRSSLGTCEGRKKDTGPCNTRPTGSPVRAGGAPARPDPTPGDERAVIDASPRSFPLRHSERGRAGRARQPRGRVVSVGEARIFSFFLSRRRLARTWLLPSNRPTHRARRSLGSVAASADGFGSIPRGVVRFSTAVVAYGSVAAASGRYAGDRLRPANREPTARGCANGLHEGSIRDS